MGAAKYREMRWTGETAFPAPTVLKEGKPFAIPSRQKGRDIPCRLMMPTENEGPVKGVFMYIHGGGWVLMDEARFTSHSLTQSLLSVVGCAI